MSQNPACPSPPASRSQTAPHDLPNEYTYVTGLSDRERVDMVLQQMHGQHRWSLKTFICKLVTAQPEKHEKRARSTDYRAQKLFEAICEQDEVLDELRKISETVQSSGQSELVKIIRNELAQFDESGVGLGRFITDETVDQLLVPQLTSRGQSTAPHLWDLLVHIMMQQHPSARDTSQKYQGSIFMICMMLASAFAPQTCDKFLVMLGIHLPEFSHRSRDVCSWPSPAEQRPAAPRGAVLAFRRTIELTD
ncbi:uncharacterized protein N7515_001182 [Penicillium bovifimosum]|uniref:Uncharacterized protein n=1 Tax=Penicillium bovifimosum TaxID=126998 RepID=A0A9W9LC83_9EURO|nr:uncharacterized protein N7515_001182 [Penicillium bovifimosum]KAJ5146618.1 hypothetical protein N7515_001182 [Penicillium bovifimosum]